MSLLWFVLMQLYFFSTERYESHWQRVGMHAMLWRYRGAPGRRPTGHVDSGQRHGRRGRAQRCGIRVILRMVVFDSPVVYA